MASKNIKSARLILAQKLQEQNSLSLRMNVSRKKMGLLKKKIGKQINMRFGSVGVLKVEYFLKSKKKKKDQ